MTTENVWTDREPGYIETQRRVKSHYEDSENPETVTREEIVETIVRVFTEDGRFICRVDSVDVSIDFFSSEHSE